MSIFYLNLHENGVLFQDEEGSDLGNLDEAFDLALRSARDVMCGEMTAGRLCLSSHIDITDGTGTVLATLPFREAVTVAGL
jgi:Tfp pilus assembly ATPase PilU